MSSSLSAFYAKRPRFSVLCIQSVLVIECFTCEVSSQYTFPFAYSRSYSGSSFLMHFVSIGKMLRFWFERGYARCTMGESSTGPNSSSAARSNGIAYMKAEARARGKQVSARTAASRIARSRGSSLVRAWACSRQPPTHPPPAQALPLGMRLAR